MRTPDYLPLEGGLDLVSPSISIPMGRLIGVSNYEATEGGYSRVAGFERFDGRTKPSAATYSVLNFDAGSTLIEEGDLVTGATSGATGEALLDAVVSSGTWAGSDAAGYLVLMNVSGTFQDNEALQVSAATRATADGVAIESGAGNDTDNSTWLQDAIETTRADIQTVTGSGRIRGVWEYNGSAYAFRDNAGGTACVMFKSSSSGWVAQDLGYTVDFTSGGTTAIEEGDTVTGATSGATADVERVIVTSGTWAGGDAAGRLVLSNKTGTFQSENLDVGASANLATIAADITAITLPAGGRYEFRNYNFGGHSSTRRMYGCNGVGTAFEWDGSVFVPIVTGMTTDTPQHIAVHKKHLFLSFSGGSVQHSGIGTPYVWSVVTGAGEIGIGEECTGFIESVGVGNLTIFGRNSVSVLYGNDSSDWQLVSQSGEETGAIEWSAQMIGRPVYVDNRGIRRLETTDEYGNFNFGTLSYFINPVFKSKRKAGVTITASIRSRVKDQYRVFFSDGTGISVYFGRRSVECMVFDFGSTVVYCASSSEDSSGNEVLYFGSDNGYVYQMDSGTSFDGAEVAGFCRLPFNHMGTPRMDKRFFGADIEMDAAPSTQIAVAAEFSYADGDSAGSQDYTVSGGGGFWDDANWNEFYWSAPVKGVAHTHFDGLGTNIGILVVSQSTYEDVHTLHGMTIHHAPRRVRR